MAVGMMGNFVIHPKQPRVPKVDRDFVIMLHMWAIHPGGGQQPPPFATSRCDAGPCFPRASRGSPERPDNS